MTKRYPFKRKPREKQSEALKRMAGKKVFALLMAMRTGKTKVTLDDWAKMVWEGLCLDLVVLAPAGVYKTWVQAIKDDVPDEVLSATRVFVWESGSHGSARAKQEIRDFMSHNGPRILLMNIEALSTVEQARDLLLNLLRQRKGRNAVAVDESTAIKNHKAKRTKFINKNVAPLAEYKRILSGLITPRSPMDLFSQFEFLDPRILGHKSFYTFRARYAVMKSMKFGGREVPIIVGYRDAEDLQRRIAPHSFRVRLEDCYDLPPSTYAFREVPLTDEQKRIYKELKQFATAKLSGEKHVTATIVISQILRMHQVLCGHVRDEEGGWHTIPEKRTEALIELLEDYDGKAIIWCSYDHDIKKVSEALAKEFDCKVARFWGGNRATREDEERSFKTDPSCRFIVATAAAGGRGRTWDCADLVVYYSSTSDLEHRSQSEERPKGVGKTKSIGYIDLIAPGTVEEKFIKALRDKIDLAAIINGDTWREWLI